MQFGRYYFEHDCGRPYCRDDHWLKFFGDIAERIVERLDPRSVLDAGCAWGFLVEALRKRGVDAYGVDISDYAIENVDGSVKEFCRVASLVEPLPDRYDLITCVEVLEHMPAPEAEVAVANLCAAADRVLFSSSPFDYAEATHVNLRPPEDWSAEFARHGFLRDVGFDATFLTPWAVLYRRSTTDLPEAVRDYDRAHWRLELERHALRQTVLDVQTRLEEIAGGDSDGASLAAELDRVRAELLASRDTVIGHEAALGEALGKVRALEAELVRYRDSMEELERVHRSRAWRALTLVRRLLRGPR